MTDADLNWQITSPFGDTYTVPHKDVAMHRDVTEIADCDDQQVIRRVLGDMHITASIRPAPQVG